MFWPGSQRQQCFRIAICSVANGVRRGVVGPIDHEITEFWSSLGGLDL